MRLGVDVGDVRVGVAACDPDGLVATPLTTVDATRDALERLHGLAVEHEAVEVVVGLPRGLSGREGPAAVKVRGFAAALAGTLATSGVAVRLVDERLTTVTAEAQLRAQGRSGKRRRAVVDQAAAVVILQNALDTERGTGRPAGEAVVAASTRGTATSTPTSGQGEP